MRTLWYEGPSGGEAIPNPTIEEMVERLRRGSEYWGKFGPVGDLEWYEHPAQETPTKVGLGGLLPFDHGMAVMGALDTTANLDKARIHLNFSPRPFRESFNSYAATIG